MEDTTIAEKNPQITPNKKHDYKKYIIYSLAVLLFLGLVFLVITQYLKNKELNESIASSEANYAQAKSDILELEQKNTDLTNKINEMENPPYFTNYFPIKYLFTDYQKVGQTFTLNEDKIVSRVQLQGSFGVGNNAMLSIYQTSEPENIETSTLVGTGKFIPEDIVKGEKFNVLLNNPVELKSNITYFLLIEVLEKNVEANIGFNEADSYKEGRMYSYSRLVGGNGSLIDANHNWQPKNSYDLIFDFE